MKKRLVVTIDGPSGVGKGTVAQILAKKYALAYLDSGALYRLLALVAQQKGVRAQDTQALVGLASAMNVDFVLGDSGVDVFLDGVAVDGALRLEKTAAFASEIAGIHEVREALLDYQRNFALGKNLICDGRDMGTVVFPKADLKFFLDASVQERALRRYKQLREKGENVNLASLEKEIAERDKRDRNRKVAPLKPALDAVCIDTTVCSVEQVLENMDKYFQVFFN